MLTKFKLPNNIQIPFELKLRKDKSMFVSTYKPPLQNNRYFVSILCDLLDLYSKEYYNEVVLGDFILEPSNTSMLSFMDSQNFVKNILKFKKQRNDVVQLNNQSKQEHFDSLNSFIDSKPFWKSCKPYFFNKHSFGDSKIALNENGEILTKSMKIAKTFNSYFESVTDSFELFDWSLQSNISYGKMQNIVKSFSNHPSIIKIKQNSS